MALANIAELFFRAGLKVLIVDWDLEAPGLEKFFFSQERMGDVAEDKPSLSPNEVMNKQGVMDMLLDYQEKMTQEIDTESEEDLPFFKPEDLAINVYPGWSGKGMLKLLTAGRRSQGHFSEYVNSVLNFDWQDFYNNWHGELYFEWLRHQFEKMADVVLIDSRTGVTEMGGVCTYQFADIIVVFCAPNKQNLDGSIKMATKFRLPKLIEARGNRPLDVLIVPSRVEDRAETELLNDFRKEFMERFREFIPEAIDEGEETLWKLRIPQVPYYAFGELVAVRERGKARSDDLLAAFSTLAKTMAALGSMGDILGGISAKNAGFMPQNLREFTVQIRDPHTHAPVGTGFIISKEGKILTSNKVVQKAIGVDPCYARDEIVEIYIPKMRAEERQRNATVAGCMSQYDDDIAVLQLKDDTMSLGQEHVAILGIADRSSNHAFRSYGFSKATNYTDTYSKGTILGDISLPGSQSLRLDPLLLEAGQGSLDMPGAPVLDVDLNLVVGIISDISDQATGTAMAVNAHVLAFEPFMLPIQANMGDVYVKLGKYKDAILAYNDAIDVDPRYSQAWVGLGRAYALIGKSDNAIVALEKATYIDPGSGLLWLELGRSYKKQNRQDDAIRAFEKAIDIDPSTAAAWIEKGNIYFEKDNTDEAIAAYRKAIELDDQLAQAWHKLGNAYSKKKMHDEAIEAYNNAVKIDPDQMLEISAKRDLCIKASQELHERERNLQEKEILLREKEKLQYQYETLQQQKDEYQEEKVDLLKKAERLQNERDDLLQKTGKLQLEKELVIKDKEIASKEKKWRSRAKKTFAILSMMIILVIIANLGQDYENLADDNSDLRDENDYLSTTINKLENKNSESFAKYIAANSRLANLQIEKKELSPITSMLLALESLMHYWTPEGYQALCNSLNSLGMSIPNQNSVLRSIQSDQSVSIITLNIKGDLMAVASGNSIQLWSLESWEPKKFGYKMDLDEKIKKMEFSKDGKFLVASGSQGTIKIWNTEHQVELLIEELDEVGDISFNWNGTKLAVADYNDNSIKLLELAENENDLNRLANATPGFEIKKGNWVIEPDIWCGGGPVGFSQNGSCLVVFGENGGAVLNLLTGDIKQFSTIDNSYRYVFNQNMTYIALINSTEVAVLDVTTGQLKKKFEQLISYAIDDVALSPDGKFLAMANGDAIEVYDIMAKDNLSEWNDTMIYSGAIVQFSPNGKNIFAKDHYGRAYIWDATSGRKLAIIDVDGISDYGYGRKYDAFFPDGKYIATIKDEYVYIWPMDTKDLMESACNELGKKKLSLEDWRKYIGTEEYRDTSPCPCDTPVLMPPLRTSS